MLVCRVSVSKTKWSGGEVAIQYDDNEVGRQQVTELRNRKAVESRKPTLTHTLGVDAPL